MRVFLAGLVALTTLTACGTGTLLFASDDGDEWSVVDTPAPATDGVIGLTGTASGRTLFARLDDGVTVSSWPAGSPLPQGDAPTAPDTVDLVTVPEGEDPEPGVRYHAPLHVQCGGLPAPGVVSEPPSSNVRR